ncbi:uncharacterized protein C11orf16 homolog [Scleropages formosus]|nr:uncharacterized protein C11orf16 homolog [Scleropages formosus]
MCPVLGLVKSLLSHTLVAKAELRNSLFNVIGFSHKVTKWRDSMVSCEPDLVYEAQGWIQALRCSPGWDLLGGLTAAFTDHSCQAVHLVTNGLPDKPHELLQVLLGVAEVCPVHVFYLSDRSGPDRQTQELLYGISHFTGGSCHILTPSCAGVAELVKPPFLAESWTVSPFSSTVKYCSSKPVSDRPPCVSHLPCRWPLSDTACPISPCGKRTQYVGCQLAPGSRVLARRDVDGFYYLGTLKEVVQGRSGVFWVEFDKPAWTGASWDSSVQLTSVTSMLSHTEAYRHNLLPGDKVLAPRGLELSQYHPGSVLSGAELRNPLGARNVNRLQVLFWNGQEAAVPGDTAVWISPSLYERIVRELQWPLPVLCCHGNVCGACCPHRVLCPSLCCVHQQWWPLLPTPRHVISLGGEMDIDELERKVDLQLKELKESGQTSCPSPSLHSLANDGCAVGRSSVDQAVNTDLSLLRKTTSAPKERPAWKYWRRSQPEPQHKLLSGHLKAEPAGNALDPSCFGRVGWDLNKKYL